MADLTKAAELRLQIDELKARVDSVEPSSAARAALEAVDVAKAAREGAGLQAIVPAADLVPQQIPRLRRQLIELGGKAVRLDQEPVR